MTALAASVVISRATGPFALDAARRPGNFSLAGENPPASTLVKRHRVMATTLN